MKNSVLEQKALHLLHQFREAMNHGDVSMINEIIVMVRSLDYHPHLAQIDYLYSLHSGDIPQAKYILSLWEQDLKQSEALIRKAEVCMHEEDLEGVKQNALNALELDPNHEQALHLMAMVMYREKKYDESLRYHMRFIKVCNDPQAQEFLEHLKSIQ